MFKIWTIFFISFQDSENIFNKIIEQNVPNLKKELPIKVQEASKAPNKLAEKLKDAKVILLTDYRGINVADVTKLRTDLRGTNSEYKVIKNNIIKRALNAKSSCLDGNFAKVVVGYKWNSFLTIYHVYK